tara:strand:+ start:143 stop:778 length:636 start_codon:yes stop_codon:yes gene_type:complete
MSLELSGTTPAIKGVAGSVSAPALTGDDADTGISFPSANTIKFSTGGVERMSITDSGVTGAGGKFASYAIICDQKSAGTNGGTMNSGTWHTRDLNTEIADADGIVSISSNQFTLQAGTYLIKANAPGYYVQDHMIKLYNVTASADIAFGTSAYTNIQAQTRSFLNVRITISAARTFEIRHRCTTTKASNGFGESTGLAVEKYLIVEIYKES